MNADGSRFSHQNEQRLITRAIHARVKRRAAELQAEPLLQRYEEGPPLPVHVVQQNDLTRQQVLIYSILGQAAVQIAVQVLRSVL